MASNFIFTMKQLTDEYRKHADAELLLSYGSSGKLYAQILRGAPFEIFLSADQHKPTSLVQKGFVPADSRFTYAEGVLLLWSTNKDLIVGRPDLKKLPFNRLAIANPRTAPYGLAAQQTLKKLGVYDDLQTKLVQGENIAQTFTFVKTNNAQLGLIALAQYLQLDGDATGSAWQVPQDFHQPITQDAVLLHKAGSAAKKFFQFLATPAAKSIIAANGYRLTEQGQNHAAE